MRTIHAVAFALAAVAGPAAAQSLEPGEWQFDTLMTIAGTKPQTSSVQRCVTPEEAADAERWAGRQLARSACRIKMKKKTRTTASWTLDCPESGLRGTGSALIGHGSMSTEQHMSGKMGGRPVDMNVKTIGKRLGPCKS
jgi:hypothetical protein